VSFGQVTGASGENTPDLIKKHSDLATAWIDTRDHGWKSSVDFAFNSASGNSDVTYFTAGLTLDKKRGQNDYLAKVSYAHGEEGGVTSLDELLGVVSWKRTGSGGYYTGARLDYREDDLAELDYRIGLTVLQGYNLYTSEKGWLTPEIGLGYALESKADDSDERENFYLGLHGEYWFNDKTKVYMNTTYFIPFGAAEASYFWGEVGLETVLTERLSLKLYLQESYENSPAEGRDSNDLRFIAGVSIKL